MSHTAIDFDLPPCTTEQVPDFEDAKASRAWLSGLALTNTPQAQAQLLRQLAILNRYPVPTDERLKMLESLRDPLDFVQDQCRKGFAGRALPLAIPEQAAFDTSQSLWRELVAGYLHCLQASFEKGAEAARHNLANASLAATRALAAMSAIYLDACHAKIVPAPMFWSRLHLIYQAAEELGVSQLAVEDNLRREATAASVYIEVLLLDAAYPFELGPKQINQVAYWAQRWSGKVALLRKPPLDLRTPPLCVDLSSNQTAGFQHRLADGDALRWLELSELRKSIKKRLVLLAQGESPQTLRLGKGCVQPSCEVLLKRIYQRWCKGGPREKKGRTATHGPSSCQLICNIETIHYFLTGQLSIKHDRSIYLSNRAHEEIATFGRVATRFDGDSGKPPGFLLEEWRMLDESATELRLERPLNAPGKPLASGQLIAVRMEKSDDFMLGKLHWVVLSGSRDTLIVNVHLLPGIPAGVTIRSAGPGPADARYSRGLFLPEVEQLDAPASVITPTGWFTANRVIEIEVQADTMHRIRLDRLIERGTDFERVAFEWL